MGVWMVQGCEGVGDIPGIQCQGLAGPWYARREREAVKSRVQWFNGLVIQMRARAQTRQK